MAMLVQRKVQLFVKHTYSTGSKVPILMQAGNPLLCPQMDAAGAGFVRRKLRLTINLTPGMNTCEEMQRRWKRRQVMDGEREERGWRK